MQLAHTSSLVLLLRALIMVVSLVTFPLVAVFGIPLPKRVAAFMAGQEIWDPAPLPLRGEAIEPSAMAAEHGANRFGPAQPAKVSRSRYSSSDEDLVAHAYGTSDAASRAVIQTRLGVEQADSGLSGSLSAPEQPGMHWATPKDASRSKPDSDWLALTVGNEEVCQKVREELRRLGSRQESLETWGEQGALYRFQAQVVLHLEAAEQPSAHRYFTAVSSDPGAAMRQVLAEVQDWRDEQARRSSLVP